MKELSEFRYFLYKYIKLLVVFTIVFYINRYIDEKSKNIKSYSYNRAMLYGFFLYIGLLVFDILTYESEYVNKLVVYLLFCVLSLYFINWVIFKYMYKGFWLSLLISFCFTILFGGLFLIAFYYGIVSNGEEYSDPAFLQFNYSENINSSLTSFMTYFFPIAGIIFWATNSNNKIGTYLNQNLMGLLATIMIIYIISWYAIKIKLLNPKQILNTIISYFIILYVISVVQTYFLIDSVHNTCYGIGFEQSKKKSAMGELLGNLLLVTIVLTLILNDIRKWSFYNYLGYIIISVFVFTCMFYYSAKYPSIGILSLWNFVEWCILTSYNTHDTGNSFSFVMMNHRYNLKSLEKEGTT